MHPSIDLAMSIVRLEQRIGRNSSETKRALAARVSFDAIHANLKKDAVRAYDGKARFVLFSRLAS